MAEIYGVPERIERPKFNFEDIKGSQNAEIRYVEEIRAYVKKIRSGKNVGEIIRFQVADGYAEYMIAQMNPTELIHIDTGDAYEYQHIHLLNENEVQKQLDRQNALNKLFGKKGTGVRNISDVSPREVLNKYKEMYESDIEWSELDIKHFTNRFSLWLTGLVFNASTNHPERLEISLNKTNYLGKKTRALIVLLGIEEPKTLKALKERFIKEYSKMHHMGAE